jgi:predicted N-acetyltransferase YhbS
MTLCSIRPAHIDEAGELTQLCRDATRSYGYDDETIQRFEPALSVNLSLIASGLTFVAEDSAARPLGVTAVRPVGLGGLVLLDRIFVAPSAQRMGIGRQLFSRAVDKAIAIGGSAMLIYSHPNAAGFYEKLGCFKIGETPFYLSRELSLPMMVYSIPATAAASREC